MGILTSSLVTGDRCHCPSRLHVPRSTGCEWRCELAGPSLVGPPPLGDSAISPPPGHSLLPRTCKLCSGLGAPKAARLLCQSQVGAPILGVQVQSVDHLVVERPLAQGLDDPYVGFHPVACGGRPGRGNEVESWDVY